MKDAFKQYRSVIGHLRIKQTPYVIIRKLVSFVWLNLHGI